MSVEQHLNSRFLNLHLHKYWLSEENEVVVLPLWNLSGQLVGLQQYRPNASKESDNKWYGRYFTRKHHDAVAVWGLESWNNSNTLFVTEGVFDAAKVTWLGYSAVAVLNNNPDKSTRNWLKSLHRPIVALCDNDKAGNALKSLGHMSYTPTVKDVGEMSLLELAKVLNYYERICQPLYA